LDRIQLQRGSRSVPDNGHPNELWNCLLKQLQPFAAQARLVEKDTRDVASRPGEASGKPGRHWIAFQVDADDWKGAGHTLRGSNGAWPRGNDYVDALPHQLGREDWEPLFLFFRPAVLDGHALVFDEAGFGKAVTQRLIDVRHPERGVRRWTTRQPPDARNLRLLCFGDERHEEEAYRENDCEPDPPHGHPGGMAGRESSRRWLIAGVGRVGRARLLDHLVRSKQQ